MLIYAGIDEAGYGPMLGPLCVAATAFTINDAEGDICDLWKRLNRCICRRRTDKRRRIAIDDSKNLKLPNDAGTAHPLKHLERGVLSFVGAAAKGDGANDGVCSPQCDAHLFQALRIECSGAPWYQSTTPLPLAHSPEELRIAASRLKRTLESTDVRCELMRCEAIDAETFNRQVELMGVKSNVNFCAVMRHVDAIWSRWPDAAPHIVIDRQGGRTHYLNDLLMSYPDAQVQVIEESDIISQYRLQRGTSRLQLTFTVEAERSHLPVALASMIAKYVRELFMLRLNRYFQGLMPELKATAGYTEDARRYLAEIESLISNHQIDRRTLVRTV